MGLLDVYHGTIELLTPLHHGGDEKTGSTPTLRTIVHWDPERGTHVRLPILSGNAIRGLCRRLMVRDFLREMGYELESRRLWHFLMSGGTLESTNESSGTVDLRFRRQLRDTIPLVGLFGGSIGNQIIDGVLQVGHGLPVCAEYRHYLRSELESDKRASVSVRTFVDTSFATRRDDLRERADDDPAVQMKVDFECLIPGTLLQHEFRLLNASDLERAAFGHMVRLWQGYGAVAAKASSGYGRIVAQYDGLPSPNAYLRYLVDCKREVREFLDELSERLG